MVKGGGGKIVNIASLSGQRGGNGRAAYGSAKAGLELLTKVMAVELAPHNINVNNIAPGAIETEMAKFAHDQATRAAYNYLIPMSRYGKPEEIADAAVFLCSDESRYVQGHTLNVDGGFRTAGLMFGPDKAAPSRR
jgi:3-oxoacyl-[acyl-carrier protein] reductase